MVLAACAKSVIKVQDIATNEIFASFSFILFFHIGKLCTSRTFHQERMDCITPFSSLGGTFVCPGDLS